MIFMSKASRHFLTHKNSNIWLSNLASPEQSTRPLTHEHSQDMKLWTLMILRLSPLSTCPMSHQASILGLRSWYVNNVKMFHSTDKRIMERGRIKQKSKCFFDKIIPSPSPPPPHPNNSVQTFQAYFITGSRPRDERLNQKKCQQYLCLILSYFSSRPCKTFVPFVVWRQVLCFKPMYSLNMTPCYCWQQYLL